MELKTIKNITTHPYIFGIKGRLITQFAFIVVGILALSLIGIIFLLIGKLWGIAIIVFILAIISVRLVYGYYRKLSLDKDFKDLTKVADVISHINFIAISKNED